MSAVGIGIGENTDLVIAQGAEVIAVGIEADGDGDIMYFLRGEDLLAIDLPGVQNFTAQGHDGLKLATARLLRRTTGGVTLHQKQLRALGLATGTIRQLAWQRGARGDLLARHFFTQAHAPLGIGNTQFGQLFGFFGVLIEPQTKGIFHHPRNKGGGFAGRETLLGLPGELGVPQFRRKYETALVPNIIGGELNAAWQELAKFTKFPRGLQ